MITHLISYSWLMCCVHAMIIPYLLDLFLVVYVLRTCHDYLLACLSLWYKNVIKIHFTVKTLKRVNMVMWALETKLVQPKGNGSPWLLGHHGMSPLHGGMAGTCFRVRDSTRSNSHRIMVWNSPKCELIIQNPAIWRTALLLEIKGEEIPNMALKNINCLSRH